MMRIVSLWLCLVASVPALAGPSQIGGRTSPDGSEEIQIDLPGSLQMKNIGGTDGAGLCVWTSINHAGLWANESALFNLQKYMATQRGGGWPDRVDQVLGKIAPDVGYIQYTGSDAAVIKLGLKTGRMPCVTYGYSPRYGGSGRISHMVNCIHLSDKWAAVLDNNFPGENNYEWMTPQEFQYRWQLGGGGWAIVLTHAGPPPIPTNSAISWTPGRIIGQCPTCPNGCCPFAYPLSEPLVPVQDRYEWRSFPDDDGQVALMKNGRQIGAYSFERGYYRSLVKGQWGDAGEPPMAPPPTPARYRVKDDTCKCGPNCPCRKQPGKVGDSAADREKPRDYGVEYDKIAHDGRYSIKGQPVTEAEVAVALGRGGPLTDDSGKWHLTVIGTESDCKAVTDDLATNSALAAYRDRLQVQSYRPGNWATQPIKLENGGKPDIVLQLPPNDKGYGKVILRLAAYPGAAQLAEAIRKADPGYDPTRDPNSKPSPKVPAPVDPPANPSPASWKPDTVHVVAGLALAGFALATFARRKQS